MSFGITQTAFLLPPFQLKPKAEQLERRLLLSATPADDSGLILFENVAPIEPQADAVAVDDATEFWQDVAENEILQSANDEDPFAGGDAEVIDPGGESLPVIPIDDTVDPLYECPGVEGEFCLPGDANHDGSVDFSDLLLINDNFGAKDAAWEDGDFDGDGVVAFSDFVILQAHFGLVVS